MPPVASTFRLGLIATILGILLSEQQLSSFLLDWARAMLVFLFVYNLESYSKGMGYMPM